MLLAPCKGLRQTRRSAECLFGNSTFNKSADVNYKTGIGILDALRVKSRAGEPAAVTYWLEVASLKSPRLPRLWLYNLRSAEQNLVVRCARGRRITTTAGPDKSPRALGKRDAEKAEEDKALRAAKISQI